MRGLWSRLGLYESVLASKASLWDGGASMIYVCPRCHYQQTIQRRRNIHTNRRSPLNLSADIKFDGSGRLYGLRSALARQSSSESSIRTLLPPKQSTAAYAQRRQSSYVGVSDGATASPRQKMSMPSRHQRRKLLGRQDTPATEFAAAIRKGNAKLLVSAFFDAAEDPAFVANIPASTWTEVLRVLSPQKWNAPFHRVHRSMSVRYLQQAGFEYDRQIPRYFDLLRAIISIRQKYGSPMTIADYRIVLRYAGERGDKVTATGIWNDMKRENLQPDLDCYNSYMSSKVFDEASRLERRVLISSLRSDDSEAPLVGGFHSGFRRNLELSQELSQLFNEMSDLGINGDTTTFSNLIFALARDNDLPKIKTLLWTFWRIDVDAILGGSKDVLPMRQYDPTSPLAPNARLLIAIADAYGSSEQIPAGLAIIDYISQQCGLKIASNVWYQLLLWTYLDASVKKDPVGKPRPKRLALRSVRSVFQTMTSPTYNIKPTMEMYHLLIKSLHYSQSRKDVIKHMEDARRLYLNNRLQAVKSPQTEKEYERKKNQQFVERWIALVLNSNILDSWPRRGLQNFVLDWKKFMPRTVSYSISTGDVKLFFAPKSTSPLKLPERNQRRKWWARSIGPSTSSSLV